MTGRVHFSPQPFEFDRSFSYTEVGAFKPAGFWYSVEGEGDGWSDWCIAENFIDITHQTPYRVELHAQDMLIISSLEQLLAFNREYSIDRYSVAWDRVTRRYSGIEIAPYRHEARFTMPWYYGWDCASGCVWDLEAISSLKILPT